VTTVLLIAPVTLTICEKLALRPVPYLIVLAFAFNIGGTATLIGDPPKIIIASRADLSFNDFLIHLTPIVVVILVAFIGLCWLLFRSQFEYSESHTRAVMDLRTGDTGGASSWPGDVVARPRPGLVEQDRRAAVGGRMERPQDDVHAGGLEPSGIVVVVRGERDRSGVVGLLESVQQGQVDRSVGDGADHPRRTAQWQGVDQLRLLGVAVQGPGPLLPDGVQCLRIAVDDEHAGTLRQQLSDEPAAVAAGADDHEVDGALSSVSLVVSVAWSRPLEDRQQWC
jgi:hypothetical protein